MNGPGVATLIAPVKQLTIRQPVILGYCSALARIPARQRLGHSCCSTTFAVISQVEFAGAVLATFFVFLPSFVFVIGGTHYIEKVRDNRSIQAFLAGVSAAVVGVIAVVSLDLIPEAIIGWPSCRHRCHCFFADRLVEADVALVAVGAMASGVVYSLVRAFT